ncbi:hypothetical protein Cst_c26190 [Thermoclostridium stercorarium subsp. stercorarium DSM 8532]|uniref:Uncharacterized protein n=1 Tax=Thermoclostridium stercorarium (strain ATCC 35414 / DSM 8532 / NCIMB 11754) TaxID=1121335 RepID=L7VSH1_THES1|nr:hypothetical protein Cst_c26190 [Thermoclostridium stercorarium subsp. stercorarium DSM 8532]
MGEGKYKKAEYGSGFFGTRTKIRVQKPRLQQNLFVAFEPFI